MNYLADPDEVVKRRMGPPLDYTDATSGKKVPVTGPEWADFITTNSLSIPMPWYSYSLQESSGTLVDSIGGNDITGTNGSYNQPQNGWSRKAIFFEQGDNAGIYIPILSGTTSVAVMGLIVLVDPNVDGWISSMMDGEVMSGLMVAQDTGIGNFQHRSVELESIVNVQDTSASIGDDEVYPFFHLYNADTGVGTWATPDELRTGIPLPGTMSSDGPESVRIGWPDLNVPIGGIDDTALIKVLALYVWCDADAEAITSAVLSGAWTAMGWSPAF